MRKKVCVVELSEDERGELRGVLRGGISPARLLNRVQILLPADKGRPDAEIAAALHTSKSTFWRIRKCFCEDGVHGALHEVVRPGGECKLTGKQEAYVIALACSTPPNGRGKWKMQLLADQVVTLGVAETIRRTLKRGHQALAA